MSRALLLVRYTCMCFWALQQKITPGCAAKWWCTPSNSVGLLRNEMPMCAKPQFVHSKTHSRRAKANEPTQASCKPGFRVHIHPLETGTKGRQQLRQTIPYLDKANISKCVIISRSKKKSCVISKTPLSFLLQAKNGRTVGRQACPKDRRLKAIKWCFQENFHKYGFG